MSDMTPMIEQDINELKEKVKKLRKNHREEVTSLHLLLNRANFELNKKEQDY